jgi:KRAB domain-containing zinc finger protein
MKPFARSSDLKVHQRVHSGEKPFTCSQCAKLFTSSVALKDHDRLHTGGKSFRCSLCVNSFRTRKHLRGHMKTHMVETNDTDTVITCEECLKVFTQLHHWEIHQLDHINQMEINERDQIIDNNLKKDEEDWDKLVEMYC